MPGASVACVGLRVYVWSDRLVDAASLDGWVLGSFACATANQPSLRVACRRVGVPRPSRAHSAWPDDDVVQLALAHPGEVLFQPRLRQGRVEHWRVLPAVAD